MCGINGFITKKDIQNPLIKLDKMNTLIFHRGPDSDGVYHNSTNDYQVLLGMRRLSIIDLESGKQPIFSDDTTKVIVFNGEIYNYLTLRQELISKGVTFKTTSDTEVVLKMYEIYGVESFSRLDGMFSFSIYDESIHKLYIARDYFGEKPLYFYCGENEFFWSSELKSIKKNLDFKPKICKKALSIYFQLTYIPAPYTIYQDIHKLKPNHYLEIDCSSFTFSFNAINYERHLFPYISKGFAIKKTRELVRNSVFSRSVADVPIGTFLSGGVDSSIISLCLSQQFNKKIDTFSIGFTNKLFDESQKAKLVSKIINSNHHEFIVSEKDLISSLTEVILNFDEPFADSSALATFLVSKKAREYVKVVLTGDGGDEVFGGYNKYYIGKLNPKYTSIVPKGVHDFLLTSTDKFLKTKNDNRGIIFKIKRLLNSFDYNNAFYLKVLSLGFQNSDLENLLTPKYFYENSLNEWQNEIRNNSLSDFRNLDKCTSLEGDMLVKVDRTSMLASLECRSPFLNKELWDFADQLPENLLINGWDKKYILKEAFKEFFPRNFLNSPKKGFGVPVGDWLRSELKNDLKNLIDIKFIEKQSIFNIDVLQTLFNDHQSGKNDSTFKLWAVYCFQKWYEYNVND